MSATPEDRVSQDVTTADMVSRVHAGDRAAEREFVAQYQRGVRVLVRRHCRPGDPIVEDLVQDVLARVLERLRAGALHDAAALAGYVQKTVVHATSAEYRRRRASEPIAAIEELPAREDPVQHLDAEQLARTVRTVLVEMPVERDREVLRRFYLDEQDKDEVCRVLDIDAAHFHRVLFRARNRFRELLCRAGIVEV